MHGGYKMIRLNTFLGLGNQMFEYAFARAISEEFNDREIYINPYFSLLMNLFIDPKAIHVKYRLGNFTLNDNIKYFPLFPGIPLAIVDFVDFAFKSFFVKITKEKFMRLSKKGHYVHTDPVAFNYFEHNETAPKIKRVKGYFFSDKYFSMIKPIICREFQVKTEPSQENKKMIDELSSCNSVCVHIRRGDYVEIYSSYFLICNEDYYKNGMRYIAEHVKDPDFYIFSNNHKDIEWIKSNYHFDYPVKYVDLNNPDYEELRLMYNCKHFVISNSTFSWWGSYLSENEEKIVVVPDVWGAPKKGKRYKGKKFDGIYRDDMIRIPINLIEEDTE